MEVLLVLRLLFVTNKTNSVEHSNFEKLIYTQLITFSALYGIRRYVTLFTSGHLMSLILNQINPLHTSFRISFWSILIILEFKTCTCRLFGCLSDFGLSAPNRLKRKHNFIVDLYILKFTSTPRPIFKKILYRILHSMLL